MFDKELMKQLATIPAENRAEWFAERDKLHALAAEMNRLNADEMVIKYGVARVIRVLAAAIKCCPDEYDPSAVRMANWVPPIRSGRNAEEWFHSTMHRAYVQSLSPLFSRVYLYLAIGRVPPPLNSSKFSASKGDICAIMAEKEGCT